MKTKEAMIIEHELREISASANGTAGCTCWYCKRSTKIKASVSGIRKQLSPPLVKRMGDYLTTKAFKKSQEKIPK